MASGVELAAIGWMPPRLRAKQDCLPTTITARQAWLKPEFAAVRVGWGAGAAWVASAAIRRSAAEGVGVAALAVAAALKQSAVPSAPTVARRANARMRSLSLTVGSHLSDGCGQHRLGVAAWGGWGWWPSRSPRDHHRTSGRARPVPEVLRRRGASARSYHPVW